MSRWYNRTLFDATTLFGKRYIDKITQIITAEGFTVLYADAKKIYLGAERKSHEHIKELLHTINSNLPGIMEIRLDAYFERVIFLDDHNQAMLNEDGISIKGFDFFSTDFCFYAKNTQHTVFKLILQNNSLEEAIAQVQRQILRLRYHQVAIEDLIIYRVLSRNPEEYADKLPHVEVAKDMRAKNYVVGPGSVIKYVVVSGVGLLHERARIPSEVKKDHIDARYYIEEQLLPCVEPVFSLFGIPREELMKSRHQSDLSDF